MHRRVNPQNQDTLSWNKWQIRALCKEWPMSGCAKRSIPKCYTEPVLQNVNKFSPWVTPKSTQRYLLCWYTGVLLATDSNRKAFPTTSAGSCSLLLNIQCDSNKKNEIILTGAFPAHPRGTFLLLTHPQIVNHMGAEMSSTVTGC